MPSLTIPKIACTAPVDVCLHALEDCGAGVVHLQLAAQVGQEVGDGLALHQRNRMKFAGTAPQWTPGTGFRHVVVPPAGYLTQLLEVISAGIDIMMAIDLHAAIALRLVII